MLHWPNVLGGFRSCSRDIVNLLCSKVTKSDERNDPGKKEEATTDLFGQYQDWIRQTLELDDRPQYTIVAVLTA